MAYRNSGLASSKLMDQLAKEAGAAIVAVGG